MTGGDFGAGSGVGFGAVRGGSVREGVGAVRVGVTGGIGSGKSTVCQLFSALGAPVYDCDKRARELSSGGVSGSGGAGSGSGLSGDAAGSGSDGAGSGGGLSGDAAGSGSGGELAGRIAALFGTSDRAEIARKVFSDRELLRKLEALVHPAVRDDLCEWIARHDDAKYIIIESAILFESGFNSLTDSVLAVTAPLEIRLRRSGFDREDFLRRAANQMTDEERVARSDYEIDNSVSISELQTKVEVFDHIFRE